MSLFCIFGRIYAVNISAVFRNIPDLFRNVSEGVLGASVAFGRALNHGAKVRMFWEVCNSFPVRREGFPVGREVWCQSVKVSSVKVLFAVRVFGSLYINKNIFIYI